MGQELQATGLAKPLKLLGVPHGKIIGGISEKTYLRVKHSREFFSTEIYELRFWDFIGFGFIGFGHVCSLSDSLGIYSRICS